MPGVIREPVPLSSDVKSFVVSDSLTGGIDTSAVDETQGKWLDVCNFIVKNGLLTVRKPLAALDETLPDGTLHGIFTYEGHSVMHIGSSLCRFDGTTFAVITDILPDADSVGVSFRDLLYLYCDTHIFTLGTDWQCSEVIPNCPRLTDSMLTTGTYILRRDDFEPNIVSAYVSAAYSVNEAIYHFPEAMDRTRPFSVERDGVTLTENEYEITEHGNLHLLAGAPQERCVINYFCTETDILDACAGLAGCTLGDVYGGGTLDGTRVILSGSRTARGALYISAPADPLSFSISDVNTVAAGTECVTAMRKQGAYELLFTEKSVFRMSYEYDSDLGGYFPIKAISTTVGCTAPHSAASVGEHTVFASDDGVYLIDSTALYDVMNAVPIGACIRGGSIGFGHFTKEEIRAASAVVCDDKYILLIADKAFVWECGEKRYVSSSDTGKAAKQLVWHRFTELVEGRMMTIGSEAFILRQDESGNTLFGFGGTSPVHAALCSPRMAFGSPHTVCRLTSLRVGVYTAAAAEVTVRVVCDGVSLPAIRERLIPDASGFAVFAARLPGYLCRTASFTLETDKADAAFGDIRIDYIILKGR